MPKCPASKKHPEVSSSSSEPDDEFLSGQEEDDSDEEIEKMTGLYKYQPWKKNFYKKVINMVIIQVTQRSRYAGQLTNGRFSF